jgi:Fic family protein
MVVEIAGEVGRMGALSSSGNVPRLRRENRIRSIHASLAIENNTLTLEQVTAVISGKRVLGPPSEIQEVKNAFIAYEAMDSWNPSSSKDLLAAHRILMHGLAADAGRFRSTSVGIAQGKRIVHLAPPAGRVPVLMKDLLGWLRTGKVHPLVAGCVFHYELEFIHPFTDGNGRMGRLWQTLILSRWNPLFSYLPVESVIRERQAEYYKVLGTCDKAGDSSAFIEFLLAALLKALREAAAAESSGTKSALSQHQVEILRQCQTETAIGDLMAIAERRDRTKFRNQILKPLLEAGLVEMTLPDKPNSRLQKYRITPAGCSQL